MSSCGHTMDGNDLSDGSAGNDAAPKDRPTMRKSASMYLNVRMPHKPDRPHVGDEENEAEESYGMYEDMTYDPSLKVQDLLNSVKSLKHRAHTVFCQLSILKKRGENYEWRESGRWVKYEETVEEGGKRWSKPHVASLSMHFMLELRRHLADGVFLKDIECYSVSQVIDKFLDEWVRQEQLDPILRMHVRTLALKPHRHRHEKGRPEDKRKSLSRSASTADNLHPHASAVSLEVHGESLKTVHSAVSLSSDFGSEQSLESMDSSDPNIKKQLNERFLRKLPKGSETANILVGEMEDVKSVLCGFLRLNDARELGEISEVPLPTRFILYLLGPPGSMVQLREMGRCISTMMVDEIFREVAYKCRDLDDLVAGIDEFLAQVTVLPPGEWDPKIRIEPPTKVPSQEIRKIESTAVLMEKTHGTDGGDEGGHDDPNLALSVRPFEGLVQDVKRKLPWIPSDFKDSLHIQCLPATLFIFLALLTNNVTFGALLGTGTGSYMGVMECVFAGAVSSILFALFSGQPLNILGSTGPMLVLEKIIFDMCRDNNWGFLSVRFWVGIWTTGFLLLLVIFNLSALVRYITRFTEECFASLIALIFIYESFKQLAEIAQLDAPMRLRPEKGRVYLPHCFCNLPLHNASTADSLIGNLTTTVGTPTTVATASNVTHGDAVAMTEEMCKAMNMTWTCDSTFVPDVFLMSVILFATTFFVAIFLVDFRSWPCFPTFVRNIIGDFAILIAILVNVGIDAAVGLPTPKLTVPSEFKPTKYEARGWLVNPISDTNPWWLYIAAGLPALLATILIFMDQHITAVIVNRAEHKLVKGSGYHLDLLVVAILVAIHSLLGLPWYVAATVNAIAHINSLKKVSECAAPGEKPTFLGVREQRVTAFFVGVLSGAAVFITNILKVIPMPVLYGVFFYMGWSALGGMQLIDRILLIFMPVKYQPDHRYLRHVPLWRVHIFTVIQVLCLIALWVVKSIKSVSIIFPLLVVFTGVVRKIIEVFFTQTELKYLDSLLPPIGRKKHDRLESHGKDDAAHPGRTSHGDKDKAGFFLNGDRESPPAYDNKGFDTKL